MGWKTVKVPATTNNLTKAIQNHLLSNGHGSTRVNTQGQWDEKKQCWRRSGSTNGASDLINCMAPAGRMWCIEIKRGKDRVRDDQSDWLAQQAAAGAVCSIIGNYSDYLKEYQRLWVPSIS